MKYITLHNTTEDYNSKRCSFEEPHVAYIQDKNEVKYETHNYYQDYLTFEITSDGNIVWKENYYYGDEYTPTIEYKKNDGEWTSITSSTAGTSFSVVAGDTVQFRGDNATYGINNFSPYNSFSETTCGFKVKGNIMSLIDSTGFTTATTLVSSYTFVNMFTNCTGLTDASNLVLPATTLTDFCYQNMFSGCTSLTTAPELPATTLANYCYYNMFNSCTSLVTAPELPATTLTDGCYNAIFRNCTSLSTAPQLHATTLAASCYYGMFNSCTSLVTAPELPATTLTDGCYHEMFYGCTSLTTAPSILPATTLAEECYSHMFRDCTSLTTAPELPATTLANNCYLYMFNCCSNLNYIKCLATDISARFCTADWVDGVASSGTFVKAASMNNWTTGSSGIPSNWTVQDAS